MKRRHLRKKIASGARRAGRYIIGTKGSALEVGGGAAAFYGLRLITSNFEQLNKHWYLPPLALAGAAHIVKKKAPKYAQACSAAIGAAGAIGAMAYEMNRQAEQNGGETKGFDTGLLMMGGGSPAMASNFALDQFASQSHLPLPAAVSEPVSVQAAVAEAAALGL